MVNPIKYLYYNLLPTFLREYFDRIRVPKLNPKNAYIPKFDETASIFIHIPKTAGTSISQALYGEQPKHYPIEVYKKIDAEKFSHFFKFAFVRNPFERLYSTYCYAQKISHPVYKGPLSEIASYETFERFVIEWCSKENIESHYFLKPQFDYLSLDGETLGVDFVGHFESINEDFTKICKILKMDVSLPQLNVSSSKAKYMDEYSEQMKMKIAEVYKKDIEAFGY